jgi:ubiquinone/menaquinone biosynthesis C-methylase UbiE
VKSFYREARRVLKPGGALAAWCYPLPTVASSDRAERVIQAFWQAMDPFKTEAHHRVDNRYKGLEPDDEEFGVVERTEVPFEQESTIWHLVRPPIQ